MTNEEFVTWAMQAWQKEVLKNLPSAKLALQLKASQRESKKALQRAQRSLAASQASSKRKLNQDLADIERVSKERRETLDREFDEKRWALIMDSQ